MSFFACIDKKVFQQPDIAQVGHFGFDLLHQFAADGLIAALAELNRAAQRTVKELMFDRIKAFAG